jgi:hypothetical protein
MLSQQYLTIQRVNSEINSLNYTRQKIHAIIS